MYTYIDIDSWNKAAKQSNRKEYINKLSKLEVIYTWNFLQKDRGPLVTLRTMMVKDESNGIVEMRLISLQETSSQVLKLESGELLDTDIIESKILFIIFTRSSTKIVNSSIFKSLLMIWYIDKIFIYSSNRRYLLFVVNFIFI